MGVRWQPVQRQTFALVRWTSRYRTVVGPYPVSIPSTPLSHQPGCLKTSTEVFASFPGQVFLYLIRQLSTVLRTARSSVYFFLLKVVKSFQIHINESLTPTAHGEPHLLESFRSGSKCPFCLIWRQSLTSFENGLTWRAPGCGWAQITETSW